MRVSSVKAFLKRVPAAALALLLLLVQIDQAWADHERRGKRPRRADRGRMLQPGGGIGPDRAAAIARDATGARVLGVRPAPRGAPREYMVKILTPDGRVLRVPVDAATGAVGR